MLHQNRKRNRLKGYDYNQDGWYFVIICTKNRVEWFGEVKDKEMVLNKYGEIVKNFWQKIPEYYEDVYLDEWVVMPNHIHGDIIIERNAGTEHVGTEHCSVPTNCSVPTGVDWTRIGGNAPIYGLLSKIIKSFKEVCVKDVRKNFDNYEFAWQRSFYDHIIRNEKSLIRIRDYIRNNPARWELDRNNREGLYM